MKIIGAGFPKTGTKSLALALRDLGYTVHDFEEHMAYNLVRNISKNAQSQFFTIFIFAV